MQKAALFALLALAAGCSPTPKAAPADFEITLGAFRKHAGGVYVPIQIANRSDRAVKFVTAKCAFYDAGGTLVESNEATVFSLEAKATGSDEMRLDATTAVRGECRATAS